MPLSYEEIFLRDRYALQTESCTMLKMLRRFIQSVNLCSDHFSICSTLRSCFGICILYLISQGHSFQNWLGLKNCFASMLLLFWTCWGEDRVSHFEFDTQSRLWTGFFYFLFVPKISFFNRIDILAHYFMPNFSSLCCSVVNWEVRLANLSFKSWTMFINFFSSYLVHDLTRVNESSKVRSLFFLVFLYSAYDMQ